MSDIAERLRIKRNPMLDGEREEAADEIERLRKELHLTKEWLRVRTFSKHRLEDEIERLRKEATKASLGIYNPALVLEERDAEIERLRDELATYRLGKHHTENAKLKAEIEQLRELLRAAWARDGSTPVTWPPKVREALGE